MTKTFHISHFTGIHSEFTFHILAASPSFHIAFHSEISQFFTAKFTYYSLLLPAPGVLAHVWQLVWLSDSAPVTAAPVPSSSESISEPLLDTHPGHSESESSFIEKHAAAKWRVRCRNPREGEMQGLLRARKTSCAVSSQQSYPHI